MPALALAFVWFAATLWVRPLMLPDEGRYVGVAWEMLRSHDWLTPTLNGLPYFHKPPLFYWITAASMALFGPHAWAARAAPLLGACVAAAALFLFMRRWGAPGAARAALLALLAQPLFYLGAQFANLDMLVAGMISATVLLAADALLRMDAGLPWRRSLFGAWLFAALGVLAKGLIGIVIPGLVMTALLLLTGRWRRIGRLFSPAGLAVFVGVGAPWFVAMAWRHPGFLDYFFLEQHFRRYAAGGFNNVQPFWFYGALIALCALPWWPWVLRALRTPPGAPPQAGFVLHLMVLWAVATIVFFSLPASKLVGYVLPAVPPLAGLAALGWAGPAAPGRGARLAWFAGQGLLAVTALAVLAVVTLRPAPSGRAVAEALARQARANEPLWMIERYAFDVPFHARLAEPARIVDDWTGPGVRARDDWKRELADAGRFAPDEAAVLLLSHDDLDAAACGTGSARGAQATPPSVAPRATQSPAVFWVLATPGATRRHPWLDQAQLAHDDGRLALWRVQAGVAAATPACRGTPSAGSPGR